MKVALAQINTIIGDYDGNRDKILRAIGDAGSAGAELVVFPELAINGYPPRDLLEQSDFVPRGIRTRDEIAAHARGIHAIVGYVDYHAGDHGRRFHNSAALIGNGRVESIHHKTLLPTYDIFDEDRYFEPARSAILAEVAGCRIGISICEDIWTSEAFYGRRLYSRDPVAEMAALGARIIVNISASPFETGKTERKYEMLQRRAQDLAVPVLHVNQVGGNDELVFDGGSIAFNAAGERTGQAPFFEEGLVVVETDAGGMPRWEMPDETQMIHDALVLGLRDYVRKCGFETVVLGLSGGIDSAVTAAIAADAVGARNVIGISMPSRHSSPDSITDAQALAKNLGLQFITIPIEPLHRAFEGTMAATFAGRAPDVTEENMQARIRGNILMAYSNKFGALLLTTGNKSELAVGYCTLYGDMNGGLAVISDVPKSRIWQIARHVNRGGEIIPRRSIDKVPSAELRPNQTDQDTLPPYDVLDPILHLYIEQALSPDEIIAQGRDPAVVRRVIRMVDANEYKRRQAPPGIKVTSKSFGTGRRIPIARHISR